ncbi:hypothetical protein NEOC84_001685|nr:hypothetical protein [Neochlamydia sp. AcF84]
MLYTLCLTASGTYTYMRKNAAIGVIFNSNKSQVLLVKRQDIPLWVLPGGGVEDNESSCQAVIREVLEETGLTVQVLRKVAEYTPINKLSRFTEIYECSPLKGNLQKGAETREIDFFPLQQLPKHFFFLHKEWLQDALKDEPHVIYRSLNHVTYINLIKYFFKHPTWVLRFLMTLMKNKE